MQTNQLAVKTNHGIKIMDRLPRELVTEILSLTQEEWCDLEKWYNMRLIDRGFKALIDACPKLWRRVDPLAGYAFVRRQIERAKGMPLWVQTDVSREEPRGAAWVLGHSDLIERLTLFVASSETHDSLEIVTDIFDIVEFPHLRRLCIRRDGPSGDRTLSLPPFRAELLDASALTHIEFFGISYPTYALSSNTSLRSLFLDTSRSAESTIALADLQQVLPALPLLSSLTLGGIIDVDSDDLQQPPSTLLSLTEFAYFGSAIDLDRVFTAFPLPNVTSWTFRLTARRGDIPTTSGFMRILRACVNLPAWATLRWLSSTEGRLQLFHGNSPRTFSLRLSVQDSTPSQVLSDLLDGVESLPSVTRLDLHGGPSFLQVGETIDEDTERVLVALRSVERVVVHGNGNSWENIPRILQRRLAQGDNVWGKVVFVEFGRGVALPHVARVWLEFFGRLQSIGEPLRVLKLTGWTLQTASPWEFRTLAAKLREVVEMVEGEAERDEWQVTF